MPVTGLDQLRNTTEEIRRAIPDIVTETQRRLIASGLEMVVRRSPVLTGAYRAEHAIATGDSAPSHLIFEAENRVGPDVDLPVTGEPLDPPDVTLAEAALEALEPYQNVWVFNDRYYAGIIEYGSADREPRFVYGQTSSDLESIAQGVTESVSRERLSRIR